MWQGIKTLTGCKDSYTPTNSTDRTLPDSLNHFLSCFDRRIAADTHAALPGKDNTIQLDLHEVRSTLHKVNTRKAARPDGVTSRILKACADQLVEVFITILKLSLLQSAVPTCLKSATIITLPNKGTVMLWEMAPVCEAGRHLLRLLCVFLLLVTLFTILSTLCWFMIAKRC